MKVTQIRYKSGSTGWKADLGYIKEKRVVRFFPKREDAENYLRNAKAALKAEGEGGIMLSSADRILFASWKSKLEIAGTSIEEVCRYYFRHHKPLNPAPDLYTIVSEFITEQTRVNSPKYVDDVQKANMRSFLSFMEPREIAEIDRLDVLHWMEAGNVSLSTKRNRRASASGFFQFAKTRKYIATNPISGENNIPLANKVPGEILSYGTQEIRKLLFAASNGTYEGRLIKGGQRLSHAHEGFLGYLTAAVFCGVRPEEIRRTPLAHLDLEGGTFFVTGRASKTNKPRVIELSPVAIAWFQLWRDRCPDQMSFIPETFVGRWNGLRSLASLPAVHDGLRHTFASMHYAMHQNAGQLKAIMGHEESENTLFAHYRAVVTVSRERLTKTMASEFWNLTPSNVLNVDTV